MGTLFFATADGPAGTPGGDPRRPGPVGRRSERLTQREYRPGACELHQQIALANSEVRNGAACGQFAVQQPQLGSGVLYVDHRAFALLATDGCGPAPGCAATLER